MRPRAITLAALLLLGGCGGGDEAAAPAVSVRAGEYAFLMPDRVEGGVVAMRFTNIGREIHEFVLARLLNDKTVADVKAFLATDGINSPPWMEQLGGVPLLSPRREIVLTQELDEGRYVFICTFPTRTGVPHHRLGMIKEFEIAGDSGRDLPKADATVTARDATMDVPALAAGRHVLKLENRASGRRGFDLVTFKARDRNKFGPWAAGGFRGRPPGVFLGAMHAVAPATTAYVDVTLDAGKTYVFLDDQSGVREEFVPR
jgi:hypothetical protein